jgi:SAM-dependent methyltransferase
MDPAYVIVHAEMDRHHWWFRGRLAVVREVVSRVAGPRRVRLLELGCGSGNVLEALTSLGEAVGMEHEPALLGLARAAGLDVRQGTLPDDLVVPDGWADIVLLLDVLEHLEEEAAALATARRALRGNGRLVVTVPAYPWLWSSHDVVLGHRRRYSAPRLRRALEDGGFQVEWTSYFNTLLFAPLLMVRFYKRLRGGQGHDLVRPRATLNTLLAHGFALERHLVPRVGLPFGASLLAVARRC